MPRYYCDYCDTYLTHDSPSVRKQHNAGYKHKANVRSYYQQFEEQQTQSLIDQRIKEHIGQTGGYHQVGAAYNEHLALQGNPQRPRLPVLPQPLLPYPGGQPLVPGMRPPVLVRPPMPPGYMGPPMGMSMGPPGAPMPVNGLPGPPTLAPGGMTAPPSSNGAPSQTMYQANPTAPPSSGGFDSQNVNAGSSLQMPPGSTPPSGASNADSFGFARAPE